MFVEFSVRALRDGCREPSRSQRLGPMGFHPRASAWRPARSACRMGQIPLHRPDELATLDLGTLRMEDGLAPHALQIGIPWPIQLFTQGLQSDQSNDVPRFEECLDGPEE